MAAAGAPQLGIPIVPGVINVHVPFTGSGQNPPALLGTHDPASIVTAPIHSVFTAADTFAHLAADLVNPNFWVRVAEFLVGSTLIVVGVGGMLRAGEKARSGARTAERAARVTYSVTPSGKVNSAARSVARTARRSRA